MTSHWIIPGLVSGVIIVAMATAALVSWFNPDIRTAARLDPIILKSEPIDAAVGDVVPILLTGSKYVSCTDIIAVWQWIAADTDKSPRPSVQTTSARHRQEISRIRVSNLSNGPFDLDYDVPIIELPFSGLWQIRLDVLYKGACDVPVRRVETTYSPAILIHAGPSDAP